MRKILLLAFAMLLSISAATAAIAAPPAAVQDDEAFNLFYESFRDAVSAGERNKVADLTDFEKFTWEANEDFKVKDRETFLENYQDMFTSEIRNRIETADPIKIDGNSWFVKWRMQDSEYSLHFYLKGKDGFRFSGLAVGPY